MSTLQDLQAQVSELIAAHAADRAEIEALKAALAQRGAAEPAASAPPAPEVLLAVADAAVVPVVSIAEVETAVPLARSVVAGGLRVIEIVFRTTAAEESLARICQEVPELIVGAGTVLSVAQAERAVAAGARFIVAPGLNASVVRWCLARGVAVLPGVATPTEIEAALALGLTHLKFFPAETLGGVSALKALSAPYGAAGLRFMPTGGVTLEKLPAYLALPAVIAVGGSWMVPADALKARAYDKITQLVAKAVDAVAGVRPKRAKA
jgi:2-dehydro-3-deoxyphosphogluconate aldolase/(4S)-4-hydroxy-2-oxoglutarate aldolase